MAQRLLYREPARRTVMQTASESVATWADGAGRSSASTAIELELIVTDTDVCAELETFPDVRSRNDFALEAQVLVLDGRFQDLQTQLAGVEQ